MLHVRADLKIMKICNLCEGPHNEAEENCEEEGKAETTQDERTAVPIPFPLCHWEITSGIQEEERVGEGILKFVFI